MELHDLTASQLVYHLKSCFRVTDFQQVAEILTSREAKCRGLELKVSDLEQEINRREQLSQVRITSLFEELEKKREEKEELGNVAPVVRKRKREEGLNVVVHVLDCDDEEQELGGEKKKSCEGLSIWDDEDLDQGDMKRLKRLPKGKKNEAAKTPLSSSSSDCVVIEGFGESGRAKDVSTSAVSMEVLGKSVKKEDETCEIARGNGLREMPRSAGEEIKMRKGLEVVGTGGVPVRELAKSGKLEDALWEIDGEGEVMELLGFVNAEIAPKKKDMLHAIDPSRRPLPGIQLDMARMGEKGTLLTASNKVPLSPLSISRVSGREFGDLEINRGNKVLETVTREMGFENGRAKDADNLGNRDDELRKMQPAKVSTESRAPKETLSPSSANSLCREQGVSQFTAPRDGTLPPPSTTSMPIRGNVDNQGGRRCKMLESESLFAVKSAKDATLRNGGNAADRQEGEMRKTPRNMLFQPEQKKVDVIEFGSCESNGLYKQVEDASDVEVKGSTSDSNALGKLQGDGVTSWECEADMLYSFVLKPELCMEAFCVLYRQGKLIATSPEGRQLGMRGGSFVTRIHKSVISDLQSKRENKLARFLMDGDLNGPLKKTVEELKQDDPAGLDYCRQLVTKCSEQVFDIYKKKVDPYFC